MKKLIISIALAFCLTFVAQTSFASPLDTTVLSSTTVGAFGEVIGIEKGEEAAEKVPAYIRGAKELSKDFTGYKVELFTVYNEPLSLKDKLFQLFGNVSMEKTSVSGYTYLLGGDFDSKQAVEEYLNKVVKAKYPDAKGVKYENGNRVTFK